MKQTVVIYTSKNHQDNTSKDLKEFLDRYIETGFKIISITPTKTVFTDYLLEAVIILEQ